MRRLTFFLVLLSSFNLQAQGVLSGTIMENGKALPMVTIALSGSSSYTTSDHNGYFKLEGIPYGKQQVIVTAMGYKTQYFNVTINDKSLYHKLKVDLSPLKTQLDEVVVSGTLNEVSKKESAVPVEVYSAKFFFANPTPSIFESMENINGVRPQLNCNVCNTGDIHINGLEGPYTMVLIDGMPIVSGLATVYGLNGIPQSLIQRMEVVKGPASTLYGSEAVGGLINIITKDPLNTPRLTTDFFATSWQEYNLDLGYRHNFGKKASTLLGVNYFNYQNPIDNNGDGFTDLTLQERVSIFNKWSFKRAKNRLFSIAGRFIYEDRWGGQMNWTPEYLGGDSIYGEAINTKRWELFGVYQLPTTELLNIQLSANGHKQESAYGETLYDADQQIIFGQLTWNKKMSERHHFVSGIAVRYTYYDDNTPATYSSDTTLELNQPDITYIPGVFVQDEMRLDENNKLLMGVRYDYNSIHGSIWSPRVNYKWTSNNKKKTFRLGAGNGYRVANVFTEDHAALTGARDVVFQEELNPETSWNINANFVSNTFTSKGTFIILDISAFYTHFDNKIIPDYDTDPNLILYKNLEGYSISRGISLNTDINWNNGLSAMAGATIQDVYQSDEGVRTEQLLTESFSGVWRVSYEWYKLSLRFDYTGSLIGPMRLPLLNELDDRDEYSPWYSIQNIKVSKNFNNGWEIYGGIKNLLNFTPAANSIARAHDPFDKNVKFDDEGNAIPTPENPNALTFDPTYVYASNQGIRFFIGVKYTLL